MPIAPKVDDPELASFHRKLLDYLRRITTKLSNTEFGGGGGDVETFAATMTLDFDLGNNVWTDVEWDDPLRMDAFYSHSATTNPEQITLLQAGLYLVLCDLHVEGESEWYMQIANGDDDVLSYSYYMHNSAVVDFQTGTIACPIFAPANGVIKIQGKAVGNHVCVKEHCRITILYLGTLAGSGGVPGVAPSDDPWWKYTL